MRTKKALTLSLIMLPVLMTGCSHHDFYSSHKSNGNDDVVSNHEQPSTTYSSGHTITHDLNDQKFHIELSGRGISDKWIVEQATTYNVEVEVCDSLTLDIYFPISHKVDNISESVFKLTSNEEIDAYSMYKNTYNNSINYNLIACSKFETKPVYIQYENKTYTLNIKSKDHDMSRYSNVTESDLNGNFKAFNTMLTNIKHHDFVTPYPGRDSNGSYGYSPYWNSYDYTHHFREQYDTDYVQYLPDSVYYPSKMDFPFEDIGNKSFEIPYSNKAISELKDEKMDIPLFTVGYSVIDPDCTNPKNIVRSICFYGINKKNITLNLPSANTSIWQLLHNKYRLLSSIYPDSYNEYSDELINVKLIKPFEDTVYGFFEDDTYVYMLTCSLNNDLLKQ